MTPSLTKQPNPVSQMGSESTPELVIVTGLSGSGCSVALKTLEDLGYYCVDCLPIELIQSFIDHAIEHPDRGYHKLALGVDIRSQPSQDEKLDRILQSIKSRIADTRIIYLTATDACLHKRYSETRRRHPLATKYATLTESFASEREILLPVKSVSDVVIDTSNTSIHQLRRLMCEQLDLVPQQMMLLIESFGYKKGVPADIDVAFDVRCLPNPHWDLQLRGLTGRDKPVMDFFRRHDIVQQMIDDISGWMERWLPEFVQQQRNYLTLGIGCTGGKHRSVYIVERLTERFTSAGYQTLPYHRELI